MRVLEEEKRTIKIPRSQIKLISVSDIYSFTIDGLPDLTPCTVAKGHVGGPTVVDSKLVYNISRSSTADSIYDSRSKAVTNDEQMPEYH